MKNLDKKELKSIYGGVSITTILNTFSKYINIFLEAGQNLGSSIRRYFSGNMCGMK